MQVEELFEFVYVLIDKRQVTAREMAERFGVSVRTVYRWVEALSVAGIPVYSMKGRGGGIAISEGYSLDRRILSEEEKLAIVSSVKAMSSLGGSQGAFGSAGGKAAEKLSHLVAGDAGWLEVDFAPWSPDGKSLSAVFAVLRECILKKRQVTFDYFRADGKLEARTVHPWKLIYKGQAWYLHGWCVSRREGRFFKLTRMRNAVMTARNADARPDAAGFSGKAGSPQVKLLSIRAKVLPPRISFLLDTFVCSEVVPHKDGSITASFSVPDEDWAYDILLGLSPNMRIISPRSVRQKVLALAEKAVILYK